MTQIQGPGLYIELAPLRLICASTPPGGAALSAMTYDLSPEQAEKFSAWLFEAAGEERRLIEQGDVAFLAGVRIGVTQ